MRRSNTFIIALLALLTSCNEVIEVAVREAETSYFVVDGLLTDMTGDNQDIILSRSISYFSEEGIPAVSGAEVTVSDGSTTTLFTELEDTKGTYRAPAGFACTPGKTYDLSIKAVLDGLERSFSASSEMPEEGCRLDSIRCIYTPVVADVADSCWTVLAWGKDLPGDGYFMMIPSVNGYTYPMENHMVISDYYFANKSIEGFPSTILLQTKDNYDNYGECAKFLEKGDVIQLDVYSTTREYYLFAGSITSNVTTQSIPLFSPQPCNCPTNIASESDDCEAMGFFSCANISRATFTIEDPFLEKHDTL